MKHALKGWQGGLKSLDINTFVHKNTHEDNTSSVHLQHGHIHVLIFIYSNVFEPV